ncbi:hypothetical protein BK816_07865 [Boudabousia tangfeifanii]|uniref:Sec-independent protein translocase protein TatA n=1 Tax=Boudabousia tangfeifanii TaxID=1912795 RepID=A0A1D9MLN8_9ACTO|nr:twin-arginine translocase TatA/TatE family subunit [Boudabousia tangfeifanii]AOZ73217.1 hypothetical protein BK816_07865 [Boudabousia tangfeifanii]
MRPSHILIIVIVLLLLFASSKLPELAKNLGKSAKILKDEAKDLTGNKTAETPEAPTAPVAAAMPNVSDPTIPQAPTNPVHPANPQGSITMGQNTAAGAAQSAEPTPTDAVATPNGAVLGGPELDLTPEEAGEAPEETYENETEERPATLSDAEAAVLRPNDAAADSAVDAAINDPHARGTGA